MYVRPSGEVHTNSPGSGWLSVQPRSLFYDIGAVVYHLRLVTWQIPGFSPELYDAPLRRLHEHLHDTGRVDVKAHRFLVVAERL